MNLLPRSEPRTGFPVVNFQQCTGSLISSSDKVSHKSSAPSPTPGFLPEHRGHSRCGGAPGRALRGCGTPIALVTVHSTCKQMKVWRKSAQTYLLKMMGSVESAMPFGLASRMIRNDSCVSRHFTLCLTNSSVPVQTWAPEHFV